MGVNAQTSVPTFTAGDVLTAANMNISARTGVPVFATTTTRDAAFGGTGEKTLAEGQLAYMEDSNTVLFYDGTTWQQVGPPGMLPAASASFSASSSVNVDNCFVSSTAMYQILLDFSAMSSNMTVTFQFRDGSGNYTSANYDWSLIEGSGSAVTASLGAAATSSRIQFGYTTPGTLSAVINVFNPADSGVRTQWISQAQSQNSTTNPLQDIVFGSMRVTNAFTGFSVVPSTGTVTGKIRIYGYAYA